MSSKKIIFHQFNLRPYPLPGFIPYPDDEEHNKPYQLKKNQNIINNEIVSDDIKQKRALMIKYDEVKEENEIYKQKVDDHENQLKEENEIYKQKVDDYENQLNALKIKLVKMTEMLQNSNDNKKQLLYTEKQHKTAKLKKDDVKTDKKRK